MQKYEKIEEIDPKKALLGITIKTQKDKLNLEEENERPRESKT